MTFDEMEADVRVRLTTFENCLPREIDPIRISRIKLPSKILWCREALIWRMAELVRTALKCFDTGSFCAAIVLARAAVETNAALWYIEDKVDAVLSSGAIGDLDNFADRLLFGNQAWDESLDPVRVGRFMEVMEKRVPGFREQYAMLSEYAHPNYIGSASFFSSLDREKILITLGVNERSVNAAKVGCMANLSATLALFEVVYNRLSDKIVNLVKLCESLIPPLDS